MNVLVIDSVTSNTEYKSINFTKKEASREYIEHADDILSILKGVGSIVFANVVEYKLDDPYTSINNHKNLNKVLRYVVDNIEEDESFDAIYVGVSYYNGNKTLAEETDKLINKIGIPIICPAENNKKERDKYKNALYLSPSGDNPMVKYICSIENSWPNCLAFKGTQGSEKQKKQEYSSRLAAMYILTLNRQ